MAKITLKAIDENLHSITIGDENIVVVDGFIQADDKYLETLKSHGFTTDFEVVEEKPIDNTVKSKRVKK